MRTLHLTTSLPYPPASGGAIRVHGIVEGLKRAGHDVTILCFHDGDAATAPEHIHIETVAAVQRSILSRLKTLFLSQQADIATRFYSEAYANKLRALLRQQIFDLVQFEGIEMVCYLPIVKAEQPAAKLCFDTFNAEYALQRAIYEIDRRSIRRWHAAAYSFVQVKRIKRFERAMCRLADVVLAVSPEDAELLRGFRADGRIHVVPNGVWVDDYAECAKPLNLGDHALVFTGKMDYRPNVDAMLWFSESVFPQVVSQIPDAKLYIVGQLPHVRLEHLQQRNGIHITGWVDSVLPYLHGASVYVAPLRMGSGTRLKLLGAMAAGCAIVATSTASAGLCAEAVQGMIVVDDGEEMAKTIIKLLQDAEHRRTLGKVARERVRAHYDWSSIIPNLIEVYRSAGLRD